MVETPARCPVCGNPITTIVIRRRTYAEPRKTMPPNWYQVEPCEHTIAPFIVRFEGLGK